MVSAMSGIADHVYEGNQRRLGFSIRYTATIVVIVEIFAFSNRYNHPPV